MRVERMSIIVVDAPEVGADSTSWDLLTQVLIYLQYIKYDGVALRME